MAAVELTAPRERFSQTAFPVMVPPASRMRVTIVASVCGVQLEIVDVPRRQGMEATQMLSFRQRVLFLRTGVVLLVSVVIEVAVEERVKRQAQAFKGFDAD